MIRYFELLAVSFVVTCGALLTLPLVFLESNSVEYWSDFWEQIHEEEIQL